MKIAILGVGGALGRRCRRGAPIVNALHLLMPGVLDVAIGKARSDIHDCPAL